MTDRPEGTPDETPTSRRRRRDADVDARAGPTPRPTAEPEPEAEAVAEAEPRRSVEASPSRSRAERRARAGRRGRATSRRAEPTTEPTTPSDERRRDDGERGRRRRGRRRPTSELGAERGRRRGAVAAAGRRPPRRRRGAAGRRVQRAPTPSELAVHVTDNASKSSSSRRSWSSSRSCSTGCSLGNGGLLTARRRRPTGVRDAERRRRRRAHRQSRQRVRRRLAASASADPRTRRAPRRPLEPVRVAIGRVRASPSRRRRPARVRSRDGPIGSRAVATAPASPTRPARRWSRTSSGRGASRDERVLAGDGRGPARAVRAPTRHAGRAYADEALPIDAGQTISQPYMVARMTELLDVQPGRPDPRDRHRLRLPGGVLAALGADVTTLERHAGLDRRGARAGSTRSGSATGSRSGVGDGSLGDPAGAPWDGIIVTAAAPAIPIALRDQLADGGRLVIPVGPRDRQILTVVTRHGDDWTRAPGRRLRLRPARSAPGGFPDRAWPRRRRRPAGRRSVYSAGHDPRLRRAPSGRCRALVRRPHREPARARPERHDPHGLLGRRRRATA